MDIIFTCMCGENLKVHRVAMCGDIGKATDSVEFEIEPCPKCLEGAERDGFDAGQASAEEDR